MAPVLQHGKNGEGESCKTQRRVAKGSGDQLVTFSLQDKLKKRAVSSTGQDSFSPAGQ